MTETETTLSGKLLIAMPEMGDPRFAKTVIYMCAHSDEGGMGLIVNKPIVETTMSELLSQLDISISAPVDHVKVLAGGPVDPARGFLLHTDDYACDAGTLQTGNGLSMTATQDALQDIAAGRGPSKARLALGYAGWGPGQLEYEITQNGWLTATATSDLIFDDAGGDKWTMALRSMGIDPLLLSASAGHA